MKTYLPFIIGIALLLAGGCDTKTSPQPQQKKEISKPVVIDEAYNDKDVTLYKGQELIIRLAANATTGYEWKRVGIRTFSRSNEPVLAPSGEKYTPNDNATKRVGAGGVFEAVFAGKSAGKATITYKYIRPWVGVEKDSKTFTVQATVAE